MLKIGKDPCILFFLPFYWSSCFWVAWRYPPSPVVSPPPQSYVAALQVWCRPILVCASPQTLACSLPCWRNWPPASKCREETNKNKRELNKARHQHGMTSGHFHKGEGELRTLNWDRSSSVALEPWSLSRVSANLRISSISISYRNKKSWYNFCRYITSICKTH